MSYEEWLSTFSQPLLSMYLKQLREEYADEAGFKEALREICRTDAVKAARSFEAQELATLHAVADQLGADLRLPWQAGWTPAFAPKEAPAPPASAPTVATGSLKPALASIPLAPPVPPPGAVEVGAGWTPEQWAERMAGVQPQYKGLVQTDKVAYWDHKVRYGWRWPDIPTIWGKKAYEKQRKHTLEEALRATKARVRSYMRTRPPGSPRVTLDKLLEHEALTPETYDILRLAKDILDWVEPRR